MNLIFLKKNGAFFNLSGDPSTTVLQHQLFVDGKYIATYDKDKNVDGKFMKVRNTPFDFTTMKAIGADIEIYDEQMSITRGYDHAYALRHVGSQKKPAAMLWDEGSGRMLKVYTDQPALQVYTANGLKGDQVGKGGVVYPRQSTVCLETMHFSDSPNQGDFPTTVLRPGDTFRSTTTYKFSCYTHDQRNLISSILMYGGAASLTGLGIIGVVSMVK